MKTKMVAEDGREIILLSREWHWIPQPKNVFWWEKNNGRMEKDSGV